MLASMEDGDIALAITPVQEGFLEAKKNVSLWLSETINAELEPEYEQFLADVWVGIVLTLMVLSCVCCMCSCLLYHKFQQWKRRVIEAHNASNLEAGTTESELPSYTIASGLPSYQEALEQLRKVKELPMVHQQPSAAPKTTSEDPWVPHTPPMPLSIAKLFPNIYGGNKSPAGEPPDLKSS